MQGIIRNRGAYARLGATSQKLKVSMHKYVKWVYTSLSYQVGGTWDSFSEQWVIELKDTIFYSFVLYSK
jgi:hypothetical protein